MKLLNKYEKQIIEILIQRDKTLSQISEEIKISKPATSKHLKKLERENIIKGTYERNSIGRTIKYSLQKFHLVFSVDPANKSIIGLKADTPFDPNYSFIGYIKQKEFRDEIKQYLKEINKINFKNYMIILYGSVAQGTAYRKSDIDLLILKDSWTKKDKDQVLDKIANVSNNSKHLAKPLFKTVEEYKNMDKSLQKQIKQNGIIIYEKGKQWNMIKQDLKRYKIITI